MELLVRVIISLCICNPVSSITWDQVRCSADTEQATPEGTVPDMGRFPWLGIVQHDFHFGGTTRFAITAGVLVHPAYAIAPAEDIVKISLATITNNTKFIVWRSQSVKYTLDVNEYHLHPEFQETTFASLALLQLVTLGETGVSAAIAPVLPICLPIRGAGTFSELFTVKMSDDGGEIHKEMFKVNFVENKDCDEFYYRAKLNYDKMAPVNPICVVAEQQRQSCVWDGGAALVSRQSWGYWKLIGFGVRGPGCGAPSRFLNVHDYIGWMDELISRYPHTTDQEAHKFILRSISPIKIIMYKASVILPNEIGFCDKEVRGNMIYKDLSQLVINKNFAQGFYFMSIAHVGKVNCVTIEMDVDMKTNLAVWIEHQCHRDLTAGRRGVWDVGEPIANKDIRPLECFLYFKSVAYLEFRYYFSFKKISLKTFLHSLKWYLIHNYIHCIHEGAQLYNNPPNEIKATVEVTLYGDMDEGRFIPNPWRRSETTESWWPTDTIIRWGWFAPYYLSFWDL